MNYLKRKRRLILLLAAAVIVVIVIIIAVIINNSKKNTEENEDNITGTTTGETSGEITTEETTKTETTTQESSTSSNIQNTQTTKSITTETTAERTTTPRVTTPTPSTTTPSTTENIIEGSPFVQQVIGLVNAERTSRGLSALSGKNTGLANAAAVRAQEIKDYFSHTRPGEKAFSTVLNEHGISYMGAGENIAEGQRTPDEVMNGWMNSQGHRNNILKPEFTSIGVGYYQDSSGRGHWTQLFIY